MLLACAGARQQVQHPASSAPRLSGSRLSLPKHGLGRAGWRCLRRAGCPTCSPLGARLLWASLTSPSPASPSPVGVLHSPLQSCPAPSGLFARCCFPRCPSRTGEQPVASDASSQSPSAVQRCPSPRHIPTRLAGGSRGVLLAHGTGSEQLPSAPRSCLPVSGFQDGSALYTRCSISLPPTAAG